MHSRTRRSPARFLAPLALIAVLIAFMAIITSSGGGGSNSNGTSPSTTPAASTSKTSSKASKTAARRVHHHSRYYTVQAGDTLGGIASKTGVSLDTIQSLNPSVDPSAMTTGQKIRIR